MEQSNSVNPRYNPYKYTISQDGNGRVKYHNDSTELEAQILDFRYQYIYGKRWTDQNIRWIPGGVNTKSTTFALIMVLKAEQGEEWSVSRKDLETHYRLHVQKLRRQATLIRIRTVSHS